ncbi:MAG: flagellar basal body M-ring protein FliF [Betaproteobacteria bacterium]|nr:flagellar basal body M-ring protein FliF [Betaproteobacteria bacterium]
MAEQSQKFSPAALLEGFNRLDNTRKIWLMVALAAAIAIVVGAVLWARTPTYRVLFANVDGRDGGAILAQLSQLNVPYRMGDGGASIMVPEEVVYDTRLKLAAQGLPRGGATGFELLDNPRLGISQFAEQVNYQRALEGELARTVESIGAVRSARVHLAIPRPSVFVREAQQPSASVLVELERARLLDPEQVAGIVHLVSSSVTGLSPKQVTVVDQSGNVLSARSEGNTTAGLDATQLKYRKEIERDIAARIESIVVPVVGSGNVKAQVAADIDFSQVEQTSETFRPNPRPEESAVRSRQESESQSNGPGAGGVPGALSNQPPGAAAAPIAAPPAAPAPAAAAGAAPAAAAAPAVAEQQSRQRESTVNFELDKTIRYTKGPVGSIRRVSAAVVVNFRRVEGKAGEAPSFKALTAKEVEQITNLSREAMGFSKERGDTLNVVNATFTAPAELPPPKPLFEDPEAMVALVGQNLGNVAVALLIAYLVFGVLRPAIRQLSTVPEQEPVLAGVDLPEGVRLVRGADGQMVVVGADGQPLTGAGSEFPMPDGEASRVAVSDEARAQAEAEARFQEDIEVAKFIARKDPRLFAEVLRSWMNNG